MHLPHEITGRRGGGFTDVSPRPVQGRDLPGGERRAALSTGNRMEALSAEQWNVRNSRVGRADGGPMEYGGEHGRSAPGIHRGTKENAAPGELSGGRIFQAFFRLEAGFGFVFSLISPTLMAGFRSFAKSMIFFASSLVKNSRLLLMSLAK